MDDASKYPFPLHVPCPKCGARVGDKCVGGKNRPRAPHPERIKAGDPMRLRRRRLKQNELFTSTETPGSEQEDFQGPQLEE
jgi:hypothetical protein